MSVIINFVIYNGMEWSAIWSEIIRVISKSEERAARVRFDFRPKLHDTKFNYHFITAILKLQNSISTNILLSDLRYSFAKLRKFTDVCMVEGKFVPHTISTCVKFRHFEDLYLR